MTKWLGRVGAALLIAIVLTGIVWLVSAIVVWLDSMIPAPVMLVAAVIIFVVTLVGDWAVDLARDRQAQDFYENARRAALARDDDEL